VSTQCPPSGCGVIQQTGGAEAAVEAAAEAAAAEAEAEAAKA